MKQPIRPLSILGILALLLGASCSPQTPPGYLVPYLPEEKVVQDNTEVYDPKVDILFVVDNSGSMGVHQKNLSTNVNKFVSTFTKTSVLDYNIGVVTTDMDSNYGPCCGRLNGRLHRFVNKLTPDANRQLENNLLVGTGGNWEEMSFDPVVAALSPPNVTGHNAGFYRQDASLVVIFLTDAEDQSRDYDPQNFYKFLVDLKKGNADKVLSYGAIVPTNDTTHCNRDEMTAPRRIEDFLGLVVNKGNNIMNLCDPDYGTQLANMAKDIVDKVGSVIYLNRPPDIKSIRVSYGSIYLPSDIDYGWSFDPKKNAIKLGSKIDWASQPAGSRVKVFYNAAKY